MNGEGTKQCKKCKELINKKAKKCPHCGAKQGMPVWIIVIIVIVLIGVIAGSGDSSEKASDSNGGTSQQQEKIEYIKVTKDELDEALEGNAAAAKDTYNNKYLEISGKLATIDSDLKYISLMSSTDEWDLIGIHCTIKNNEQKELIKTLKKDQEITIKGKVTDVGEVLGYYVDIVEIVTD